MAPFGPRIPNLGKVSKPAPRSPAPKPLRKIPPPVSGNVNTAPKPTPAPKPGLGPGQLQKMGGDVKPYVSPQRQTFQHAQDIVKSFQKAPRPQQAAQLHQAVVNRHNPTPEHSAILNHVMSASNTKPVDIAKLPDVQAHSTVGKAFNDYKNIQTGALRHGPDVASAIGKGVTTAVKEATKGANYANKEFQKGSQFAAKVVGQNVINPTVGHVSAIDEIAKVIPKVVNPAGAGASAAAKALHAPKGVQTAAGLVGSSPAQQLGVPTTKAAIGTTKAISPSVGKVVEEANTPAGQLKLLKQTRQKLTGQKSGPTGLADLAGLAPSTIAKNAVTRQLVKAVVPKKYQDITEKGLKVATAGPGQVPDFPGAKKLATRTYQDAINFPAQAIPATYKTAAAGVAAAQGNFKPASDMWKTMKETDPYVNLAMGHPGKALKRFGEHPGFALIEAAALKGVGGRAVGGAMRAVPGDTAVSRLASTSGREPITSPGSNLELPRRYSNDITVKAAQVASDKWRTNKAQELRARAKQAEAKPAAPAPAETAPKPMGKSRIFTRTPKTPEQLRSRADQIDPTKMSEREIKRQVDERAHIGQQPSIMHLGLSLFKDSSINKRGELVDHAGSVIPPKVVTKTLKEHAANPGTPEHALAETALDAEAGTRHQATIKQFGATDSIVAPKSLEKQSVPAEKQSVPAKTSSVVVRKTRPLPKTSEELLAHVGRRVMGATDHPTKGLVDKVGKPLPLTEVTAHIAEVAAAAKTPANIVARQNIVRAFADAGQNPVEAAKMMSVKIPPRARAKSPTPPEPNNLSYQGAGVDTHGDTVRELRVRPTEGPVSVKASSEVTQLDTRAEAQQLSDHMTQKTGLPHKPVRVNPKALPGESGWKKWASVPEIVSKRLQEHYDAANSSPDLLFRVNRLFRNNVLATSPKWLTGNVVEGVGRALLAGVGPRSFLRYNKVMKAAREQDPFAAEELQKRLIAGGLYGSAKHAAEVNRARLAATGEEMPTEVHTTALRRGIDNFKQQPGTKHLIDLWQLYTHTVFDVINSGIEKNIQKGMAGKAMGELLDGPTMRLSDAAAEDLARQAIGTPNQIALARRVDQMYGKYDKFSPQQRKWLMGYTPFAPWAINAAYFIARTLPRDHPLATLAIVNSERVHKDWLDAHGLNAYGPDPVKGSQQGSIPVGDNFLPASRFTPMGLASDLPGNIASQVLPVASGSLAALRGETPFGSKLKDKNNQEINDPARLMWESAKTLLGGLAPAGEAIPRAIKTHGTSLNPTHLQKRSGKSSGGAAVRSSSSKGLIGGGSSSGSSSGLIGGGSSGGGSSGLLH